ncbi:MAG: hypothetical protein KA604_02560 [Candidatus Saccharimonas sp.]|nr:hypothetical protein [Candidatus Saccharimonas sp.]
MIEDQPVVETGAPPAETEVAHVDGKIPLPEYLRRENLESLLPGEIVYLYPSFVQFYDDQSTLLINTDTEVREENKQLQTYTHDKSTRLALMPFLKKRRNHWLCYRCFRYKTWGYFYESSRTSR